MKRRALRRRLRNAALGARIAWRLPVHSLDCETLILAQGVNRRLLEDGNDQVAHMIAGESYKIALAASRRYMDIGPDRQMGRTVTFA